MPPHQRLLCNRFIHCIRQLLGRETPEHGDDAVVAANSMKSQGKRSEPQPRRCDPAPPEVTHDDSHARDTIHFAKQRQRLGAGEVMQDLGAHHDVHAPVGERES